MIFPRTRTDKVDSFKRTVDVILFVDFDRISPMCTRVCSVILTGRPTLSYSLLLSCSLRQTFTHAMGRFQCRETMVDAHTTKRANFVQSAQREHHAKGDNTSGATIRTLANNTARDRN